MYAHTCATYFYSLACSFLADPKRYVVEFLRPRQGQGTLIAQRAHFIVHNFEFQKGNSILKLNFSFTFREMHHHVHCILAYKFENAQCSLQARFPIFSSIIYLAATAVDPAASIPVDSQAPAAASAAAAAAAATLTDHRQLFRCEHCEIARENVTFLLSCQSTATWEQAESCLQRCEHEKYIYIYISSFSPSLNFALSWL
jgi:hypothetical protein